MCVALMAVIGSACKTEIKTTGINSEDLDLTVSPGHDFDQYANGGWKAKNPLPGDKSRYGTFDKLRDEAEKQLQSLFDKITTGVHETGSIGRKIADFYNEGMDTVKIEELGAAPMQPYLDEIAAAGTINDIQNLIIKYHLTGNGTLFSFFGSADKQNSDWVIAQLYQGGLGLSDRDYYTSMDERSKEIRSEYLAHMVKMFMLAGETENSASSKAQQVMDIETRLAKASMTRLERRDPHATYNKMDIAGLVEISPRLGRK